MIVVCKNMPKAELQKYGAPLYAIEWFDTFGYMCGGGNNGIENKYVCYD